MIVPGKVYGVILIERLMEVTERKVSAEQGGFRKGRGCIDQIFAMKRLVEEYLGKDKKLYAAFMNLEKAYDRVDRERELMERENCPEKGRKMELEECSMGNIQRKVDGMGPGNRRCGTVK